MLENQNCLYISIEGISQNLWDSSFRFYVFSFDSHGSKILRPSCQHTVSEFPLTSNKHLSFLCFCFSLSFVFEFCSTLKGYMRNHSKLDCTQGLGSLHCMYLRCLDIKLSNIQCNVDLKDVRTMLISFFTQNNIRHGFPTFESSHQSFLACHIYTNFVHISLLYWSFSIKCLPLSNYFLFIYFYLVWICLLIISPYINFLYKFVIILELIHYRN